MRSMVIHSELFGLVRSTPNHEPATAPPWTQVQSATAVIGGSLTEEIFWRARVSLRGVEVAEVSRTVLVGRTNKENV